MKTIIDCAGNPMGEGETYDEAVKDCARNLEISEESVEAMLETTRLMGYNGEDSTLWMA
jgi:hypothetical protein